MLDLNLGEFFSTIGIGLYSIVGFWALANFSHTIFFRLLHGKMKFDGVIQSITNFYNQKDERGLGDFILLPAVIVIFCIGILIEQHTDYYADSRKSESWVASIADKILYDSLGSKEPLILMPKEEVMRFHVLVKSCDKSDSTERESYKLSHLGKSVFKHFGVDSADMDALAKDKQLLSFVSLSAPSIKLDSAQFKFLVDKSNAVYYRAKNWCYGQENYFGELENIQRRVDFTRSLAFVNYFLIILTALILIGTLLVFVAVKILLRFKRLSAIQNNIGDFNAFYIRVMGNMVVLVCMFLSVYVISAKAYTYTEKSFNERVFGYFTSAIDNMDFPQKKLDE